MPYADTKAVMKVIAEYVKEFDETHTSYWDFCTYSNRLRYDFRDDRLMDGSYLAKNIEVSAKNNSKENFGYDCYYVNTILDRLGKEKIDTEMLYICGEISLEKIALLHGVKQEGSSYGFPNFRTDESESTTEAVEFSVMSSLFGALVTSASIAYSTYTGHISGGSIMVGLLGAIPLGFGSYKLYKNAKKYLQQRKLAKNLSDKNSVEFKVVSEYAKLLSYAEKIDTCINEFCDYKYGRKIWSDDAK